MRAREKGAPWPSHPPVLARNGCEPAWGLVAVIAGAGQCLPSRQWLFLTLMVRARSAMTPTIDGLALPIETAERVNMDGHDTNSGLSRPGS
jgi:hypothetical protein